MMHRVNWHNYIFVDTETQGLPPGQLPWEIALIWRGTDVDAWMEDVIHVMDYDPEIMTEQAAAINGFHERWLRPDPNVRCLTAADTKAFLEFRLAGKMLVGSNPAFDEEAFLNMGVNPVWQHGKRDLPSMFLGAYGYDVRNLAGVCDTLGIVNEAPHTAIGDTRAARDAFEHIMLDTVR